MAGKTQRKQMNRMLRQQLILETTRSLLSTVDIETITMDRIAGAAGYTRRTIYAYFTSREEILLMLLKDDWAERWQKQQEAVRQAVAGLDKILVWGECLYAYSRDHPHATRLQAYWDYRGIHPNRIGRQAFQEFETLNDELARGLRTIFRLGVRDGSLRSDLKVDLCISQYLQSLRSVINRALSGTYSFAGFDPDTYVRHYLDLFKRSIENPKGHRR